MEKRGPVDAGLAPVGWALIGFGVATWAVALTIFEPALSALVGSDSSRGVDDLEVVAAYSVRMPWMSILVGVAGALLLLRRSRLRGWLGWGLLLGWLAADIVLDLFDVAGPASAVVVGAVAAVIVVGVVIVGAMRTGPAVDRPFATVYSGVLLAALWMVVPPSGTLLVAYYPAGLFGVTQAVAATLAVAAVITAGTATATVSTTRALAVGTIVALLVVGVVLFNLGVFADMFETHRLVSWANYPVAGAVPVGLALLTGGVTRRRLPVLALLSVMAPVTGLVALFLVPTGVVFPAVYLSMFAGGDSDRFIDWFGMLSWLFAGALLGAVALLPDVVRRRRPQPVMVAVDGPPSPDALTFVLPPT